MLIYLIKYWHIWRGEFWGQNCYLCRHGSAVRSVSERRCKSASTRNCHAEVIMQRTVLIAASVIAIAVITLHLLSVAITFHCRFGSSEIRRYHWMRLALSWEGFTVLICRWMRADRRCSCGFQNQCSDTAGNSKLRFCIVKGKARPRTGHEVSEGGQTYSSSLSLTSALDRGGWLTPRPSPFTTRRETRHACTGIWVGHRAGRDGCRKSRLPSYRDSSTGPSSP